MNKIVYICDLETMEQVGKQDIFTYRDDPHKKGYGKMINWLFGFDQKTDKECGLVSSSGKIWQEQRRFALRLINYWIG